MRFISIQIILCLCLSATLGAAELRLREEPVRCTQTLVALADIAEIVPAPGDDLQQLRQKVLCTAPASGETKTLERTELRDILSRLGLRSTEHQLAGANSVTLVGEGQNVQQSFVPRNAPSVVTANYNASASEVSPQLRKTLQSQLSKAIAVHLDRHSVLENGDRPRLPWNVAVNLPLDQARVLATSGQIEEISGGTGSLIGSQKFEIRMQKIDPRTGSNLVVIVDANVSVVHRVVVLRRTLPRGYILSESDVMLSKVDELPAEDFFVDVKEVVGMETIAAIKDRTVLNAGHLKNPTWVRKGDVVTVRSMNGGILVRTDATALEDGVRGDTIPVATINPNASARNKRARQESSTFLARVCEPKTVEVNATPSVVVR